MRAIVHQSEFSRVWLGAGTASSLAAAVACILDSPQGGHWFYYVLIFIGSYAFALVVGLPTIALLRSKRCTSWWYFVGVFFVLGTLVYGGFQFIVTTMIPGLEVDGVAIVRNHHLTYDGWLSVTANALTLGALSAFGGFIFWAIAFRGRRDAE